MEPQLNASIEQLPEETRNLFDVAYKIPHEVWFHAREIDWTTFNINVVIFGVIAGGAFGGSGIFGLIELTFMLLNDKITNAGDVLVYLVFYVILAGLVVIAWREFWLPLWYDWLTLQEKETGTLRRGIFLTEELMFLRLQTRYCDIVRRDSILIIELRGTRARSWYMVYKMPTGKQKGYDLSRFLIRHAHSSAVKYIREWAGLQDN